MKSCARPWDHGEIFANVSNGGAGIGINAKTMGNMHIPEKSGAESGALEVLERWPYLTPSQVEAILNIIRDSF